MRGATGSRVTYQSLAGSRMPRRPVSAVQSIQILDRLDEADVLVLDGEGARVRLLEIGHEGARLVAVHRRPDQAR